MVRAARRSPFVAERIDVLPSRQPCSSFTHDGSVAPAATACLRMFAGSWITRIVRLVVPPIARGLSRPCVAKVRATQKAASPGRPAARRRRRRRDMVKDASPECIEVTGVTEAFERLHLVAEITERCGFEQVRTERSHSRFSPNFTRSSMTSSMATPRKVEPEDRAPTREVRVLSWEFVSVVVSHAAADIARRRSPICSTPSVPRICGGVDPCAFRRSEAGSHVSAVVAHRGVSRRRATSVRPAARADAVAAAAPRDVAAAWQ